MTNFLHIFLIGCCAVLGVAIIFCMIRAMLGPRFTDRIVAVNMIGTMTIAIMAILSVWMDAEFLIDISIVYALLSFIAIIVLTQLVIIRRRGQIEREANKKADEVNEMEAGQND